MAYIDLIVCILLFALFVYVFATVTITNLHKAYLGFHFAMMLWPFSQFSIKITKDPTLQLFYVKLAFVDMALLAVGWLFFTLLLTNSSRLPRRNISLAWSLPALLGALVAVWNPNGWFVQPVHGGYVQRLYGPLFWITSVVLIGYGIVSLYMIYLTLVSDKAPRIKKQVRQVLRGIMVVIALIAADIWFNVIFPISGSVIPGLSSLGILLSAVFFIIAIHRDKVFDIVTIAHQDIINTITIGILVLDDNEMIVETNESLPADVRLHVGDRFEIASILPIQEPVGSRLQFIQKYCESPLESAEIEVLYQTTKERHVHIHVSPIMVGGNRVGRIITFQDMSELRRLIDETTSQNEILQQRNQSLIAMQQELHRTNEKLQHMAITDGLTGCYNRSYLTQKLENELLKQKDDQTPFSILLLDIDFFKLINDNYGHMVGDEVICSTVNVIAEKLRDSDILARFGGEEFMIYLPGTTSTEADRLAEEIRTAVEGNVILVPHDIRTLSITVSIGTLSVQECPMEQAMNSRTVINDMFQAVDQVLYQAKREGRNRMVGAVR
ncbi:diguanylate cyclase [Paenibacillus sp. SAF-054]|uniref:histidine kinase N-terminal 7TM domain-containing diguanylate cyclase n=1 Tax=unclassified Paenibacillus TaxID=185978 RepID=UPI003F81C446